MSQYSNLPPAALPSNFDTVNAMNNYYSKSIELNVILLYGVSSNSIPNSFSNHLHNVVDPHRV